MDSRLEITRVQNSLENARILGENSYWNSLCNFLAISFPLSEPFQDIWALSFPLLLLFKTTSIQLLHCSIHTITIHSFVDLIFTTWKFLQSCRILFTRDFDEMRRINFEKKFCFKLSSLWFLWWNLLYRVDFSVIFLLIGYWTLTWHFIRL